MKVFISWSGPLSKQLAEVLRDWLPSVLQLVKPYFTPSDVDKGTRWATEIAKELEASEIGILCVTRDNIHSDWMLFEAGALSKSLDKASVCPILFGISNTDLAGPLKQFQTTEFKKVEMHKLLGVINSRLGDSKLPSKTLDTVFDKWWDDLQTQVDQILEGVDRKDEPVRTERDILEEILTLSRAGADRGIRPPSLPPKFTEHVLHHYIELHNQQASEQGSYQDTLDALKPLHDALDYLVQITRPSSKLTKLTAKFEGLKYETKSADFSFDGDNDLPF